MDFTQAFMERKKSLLKIGKYILILLLPILLYNLLMYPWNDKYEQKYGIVEYNHYTGTGRKGKHKTYCNIKLIGCDTIFGYYKRYDNSLDDVRKAQRIANGDSICIYFRKSDFCDYKVMQKDLSDIYSVYKEKIKNSNIINISGISSGNKFLLDPKERKYYDPFYYWVIWLKETYLFMMVSILIIALLLVILAKFAPNFLKTLGKEAKRKNKNHIL